MVAHWLTRQFEWWDDGGVDDVFSEAQNTGYEGSDEYAPVATDHYDLKPKQPRTAFVREDALETAAAEIVLWKPEEKRFTIETKQPEQLVVRLLDYPAWRVSLNRNRAQVQHPNGTRQIIVSIPAGESEVRLDFTRTADRTLGGAISIFSVVSAIIVWSWPRRSGCPTPRVSASPTPFA